MKGLLIKDFALIMQRKSVFLMVTVLGIIFLFIGENESFAIGWTVMIMVMLSISSINYDEYDNCMPFLMTMPVSARMYAIEKYILGIVCGAAAWIFEVMIVLIKSFLKNNTAGMGGKLVGAGFFIAFALITLAIQIPVIFKWGSEKSGVVWFIMFGCGFMIGFLFIKFFTTAAVIDTIFRLDIVKMALIALSVSLIMMILSVLISVHLMEKKEF